MTESEPGIPKRIVILGAGMAGLTCAFEILDRARRRGLQPPPDVLVLDSAPRPGGNVRTERDPGAGFLCEWGPEGFLDNVPETLDLARRLGRGDRLIRANPAANKRYILRDGRLRLVPTSPPAFLLSDILPLGQRLRVFGEPFAPGPPDPDRDETVFDFAARRIGPGAAAVLVDAMVSGVYAGNARALSLQSAFPKMHKMEREYGSLVKAMLARMKQRRRERAKAAAATGTDSTAQTAANAATASSPNSGGPAGPGGVITSFVTGMEEFVEALVDAVGERRIRLDTPVEEIVGESEIGRETGPGGASDWKSPPVPGPSNRSDAGNEAARKMDQARVTAPARRAVVVLKSGARIEADAVVVATPSWAAAPLFRRSDPDLARPLDDIPFASIAVVATGHRRADVAHPLDGFGFLIPRGEGRRTLGTLWPASTFTGRAPEGHTLLRTMIGGATDPDAVTLDDAGLLDVVAREVNPVFGVRGAPVWTRIFRFPRGIAQYNVGHARKLQRIESALAGWSNLYFAGASYRGIAINATCEHAPPLADAVLDALSVQTPGPRPPARLF